MSRHRKPTGRFTIGGQEEPRASLGAALSVAQNLATRAEDEVQFGIYEEGDDGVPRQVMRVRRDRFGTVLTERVP